MPYYRISRSNGTPFTNEEIYRFIDEGRHMKSIIKNNPDKKYRRRVAIEKTAAAATVAVIVSSALSGCEFDSGTGNVTPPISGQTVATETADPTPTITVAPTATPTPAIGGSLSLIHI